MNESDAVDMWLEFLKELKNPPPAIDEELLTNAFRQLYVHVSSEAAGVTPVGCGRT